MKGKKTEGEEVDRISGLSDDILVHILSFLPSMDALRTCLLSTRWKHLWEMVPALDVEWYNLWAVDEILRLRRTKKITRLHLEFDIHTSSHLLDNIDNNVIIGEVEHVNLCLIPCAKCIESPFTEVFSPSIDLLTCTTIVTMKIEGSFVLSVPFGIQLPSLKSLHLNVWKCELATCKEFLSGSPALQVFYLKQEWRRRFDTNVSVDVGFEELRIERNSHSNFILSNNPFLHFVKQTGPGYDCIHDNLEDHLENIVEAKVYTTLLNAEDNWSRSDICEAYSHAFPILKSIGNVELLSLPDLNESMEYNHFLDYRQSPNLVQLEFYLKDFDNSLFLKLYEECPMMEVKKFQDNFMRSFQAKSEESP